MEFLEFIALLDAEAKRIGWSRKHFKQYVLMKYNKKSRYFLTDEQLWELYETLKAKPTRKKIALAKQKIGLRK